MMLKKPVALQTFTVRDQIEEDYRGTLEQVAKMGYKGVEVGGSIGGLSGPELKKFLDGLGLVPMSVHTGYEILTGDIGPAIEFAHALGLKYMVCPIAGGERAGDYYTIAKSLNKAGAKLKEEGIRLCYHNHAHEFTKFDGRYAMDIILANSKPDLLAWQLDTYWVTAGGEDPPECIRKYAGRIPVMHLKDMTTGDNPTFAEVGAGKLDWTEIFSAADEAGVEWYVVEQDVCQRPPLESARMSLENLRKMGVV